MNKLVLLFSALFALSAVANEFVGKVTKVSDGDTIWVMTEGKREKVRMDRIDAPEKNQKFGKEASAILAAMIDGKEVRVEWKKRDQYGRVLGVVFAGEKEVNLEMIRKGAWGTGAIESISNRLQQELPGLRGFAPSSIKRMRTFFEAWVPASNRPLPMGDLETDSQSLCLVGEFRPSAMGEMSERDFAAFCLRVFRRLA